jgi:cytochrome c553
MLKTRFSRCTAGATALLVTSLLYTVAQTATAKTMTMTKASSGAVSEGQALSVKFGCTRCHGADLTGKPGFAPNIHRTGGALHDYTQAQFVQLMATGMKNDGRMVHPPMPVYGKANKMHPAMTAQQSRAIYDYLVTLK